MPVDPALGYDPVADQFSYSRELVAELLPLALDGPEPPATGLSDGGRSVADPATGGNVQAMILDVRRVWNRLPLDSKLRAIDPYLSGREFPDSVLDELVAALGGPA